MFKILILSNGHGEDLSGSLIAKQFVKSGYSVHALPIVGIGNHYKKEKIKIDSSWDNLAKHSADEIVVCCCIRVDVRGRRTSKGVKVRKKGWLGEVWN